MWEQELAAMIKAAKDAEVEIKKIYQTAFKVEIKADKSPVTLADKTADALIRKELGEAFPDYGMLTEESKDTKDRLSKENIWIVDPVDGTKEFVAHNGEFTTNIALAPQSPSGGGCDQHSDAGRDLLCHQGSGRIPPRKGWNSDADSCLRENGGPHGSQIPELPQ
jgi:3'-phosphoadenosine 5'-phosphosulfate (PAPS) 3'-phosphatase